MAKIQAPVPSLLTIAAVVSGRRKVFYGWWIAVAALAGAAVGTGLTFWTFGLYIKPLEEEFGWSRAQVSGAFSVGLLVAGVTGPFAGRVIDRVGARRPILAGAVLTAGSLMLLPLCRELWLFYLVYSLHSFFRTWMFYIPFQWLLSRWFVRKRGTALGMISAGFGLGGAIFVPLVGLLVRSFDWEGGFLISGVVLLVVFLALAGLIFRDDPREKGLRPDGEPAPVGPAPEGPVRLEGLDLGTAIRSPAFWILSLAFALFFLSQISFLVHAVPFYESRGISSGQAAALVSYAALLSVGLRIAFGMLMDRVKDARVVAAGICTISAGALLLLLVSTAPPALGLFVVIWAICGVGPMLEPLLIVRTFGPRAFGAILGAVGLVETVGQIGGPVLGGAIFDATGDYDLAFILYIGVFLLSGLAFLLSGAAARLQRGLAPVEP